MQILAVVFDFDGVIADTERLHFAAFRDVFARRGWVLDEATYFDRYLGYNDEGLVDAFSRDEGLRLDAADAAQLAAAKTELFSRHLTAETVYPGAGACIEALAGRFRLAIASGALHHEITAILSAAGLLDRFPVIVAADDVSETKPSPEPYLTAAQRLGVPPSSCAAIEDSLPGLQSARAAGMRTIAVTTTSPAESLSSADRVVSGIRDVSAALVLGLGAPATL